MVKKASKKAAPKKAAPKKAKKAPMKKKAVVKPAKSDGKFYTVSKNAESGLWEVKLAQTKGASGKVIARLDTKPEAESYVSRLSKNSGRKAVIHNSKGAAKGRAKSLK